MADEKTIIEKDRHDHVNGSRFEKIDKDLSIQVLGKRDETVGKIYALESGQEIHIKSGVKIVIEGGAQVSIKGPGGFIDVGPGGVTIQGTIVRINSGGSAGSGSGADPEDPKFDLG